MAEVSIVGVYRVSSHGDVHLIESLIDVPPREVNVSGFMQEDPTQPKSNWQVAYDAKYLNTDSDQVIGEDFDLPADESCVTTRLAFFLYFIDFDRPLMTPYGDIRLPAPTEMPERLSNIIQFEEAD